MSLCLRPDLPAATLRETAAGRSALTWFSLPQPSSMSPQRAVHFLATSIAMAGAPVGADPAAAIKGTAAVLPNFEGANMIETRVTVVARN